jgi:hypothetical protein
MSRAPSSLTHAGCWPVSARLAGIWEMQGLPSSDQIQSAAVPKYSIGGVGRAGVVAGARDRASPYG